MKTLSFKLMLRTGSGSVRGEARRVEGRLLAVACAQGPGAKLGANAIGDDAEADATAAAALRQRSSSMLSTSRVAGTYRTSVRGPH
eukprot:1831994-Rhodomonas_salina.1